MDYKRWYGIFRAIVVSISDPMQLDRIRVRVPEVLGDVITDWVWPKTIAPNCSWKPALEERVWIEFENGDIDRPLYSGSWYPLDEATNQSSLPSEVLEAYDRTRIIKSPAGHKIIVRDADPEDGTAANGITIQTVSGHKIDMMDGTNDEKLEISTPNGHKVEMDDKNTELNIEHSDGTTKIEIDSSGNITIIAGTGADIELKGNGGTPPTFPVVCAGTPSHYCLYTGGPHPAGSNNVKASQ
jgi:hypothetical protein